MNEGQNQNSPQGGARNGARNTSRVLVMELMDRVRWDTGVTTPTKSVVGSTLQDVAGKIEAIQAGFTMLDVDPGPNFRCELRMEMSWDGVHWVDAGLIFGAWASSGPQRGQYKIDPAFTDTQAMGRHIRFVFSYQSSQAASAHAVLSGGVTIRFVGQ